MGLTESIALLGVSPEDSARAATNLESRAVGWIVVSGKMCSGKDTVAPLVLPRLGYSPVERVGYSDPMKAELQTLIELCHGRTDEDHLTQEVTRHLGYKPDHAKEAVQLVLDLPAEGRRRPTGWDRTDENRVILQKVGTYWRCEDDEEYWSRTVSVRCLRLLAASTSVYLTGGRFEPDVRIPQDLGAKVIRLDISREVQAERMLARDGILPDPVAVNHPGEVALDDWDRFDVRVTNEGTLEACLEDVTARLREVLGKA